MMKYIVILLSEQSTSFCYYTPSGDFEENKLIPVATLQDAIKFAFMEDRLIQFVLPSFALPKEYEDIISSTKASIISPVSANRKADVLVVEGISEFRNIRAIKDTNYVLRTNKEEFFEHYKLIIDRIVEFSRLNIIFTDVEKFTDTDLGLYRNILTEYSNHLKNLILSGENIQLNLLTDRLIETEMNNCNAGHSTITLAPDGHFYICPAFYYAKEQSIGTLNDGLTIKNKQLYKLKYAPLCRVCDAYQCKRCVFLNKLLTREVNIPSREQCMMAHIERNASRLLLQSIREDIVYMPQTDIKEIDYLDPFDNIKNRTL